MNTLSVHYKSKILLGEKIANNILDEVTQDIDKIKDEYNVTPFLASIVVGSDPATDVYMKSQRKVAKRIGINFEAIELSKSISQNQLIGIIEKVNYDPKINGLIIHLPLPEHIDTSTVQWNINAKKDVEGVTPHNLGRLFLGADGLYPCTAESILALIKATGVDIKGKEVTIVGHSAIVGKPIAMLLLKEETTVTICHYATSQRGMLEHHVRNAEILVVAVGRPNLIPGEWIKEGCIVIDAGINQVDNSIVGDVEFQGALNKAGFITPVPGGVGKVTVAYLMKNTVAALKWQLRDKSF